MDLLNLGVQPLKEEIPVAKVEKPKSARREKEFTAIGKFKCKKEKKEEKFVSLQEMIEKDEESVIYGESDSEYDSDEDEVQSDIKMAHLDVLFRKGVKKSILKEAIKVRTLFKNLGRLVVPKSKWYLVSTKWIKKWEHFCFFKEIC
jgi:hypothetical protein